MATDTLTETRPDSFFLEEKELFLLHKLKGLVRNIKWSPTDTAELFVALLERFGRRNSDRSHLLTWLLKILHLIEVNFITPDWRCGKGTAVQLVRDADVSDSLLQGYFSQEEEKQLDEIIEEIRREKSNQVDAAVLSEVRNIVSSVSEALRSKTAKLSGIKGVLLRLCRAAEAAHFRPRLTQMVSWCVLALPKTGQFLQVATGEGKSCIVAMFAAYKAMEGEAVHILTSSPVLAERDMKDWRKLFETLKIKVDCNTSKKDAALKQCYQCQVIYGTAQQFSGDYLRQCLERTDIFGPKAFQCAIVDEQDSIMLDKALHVVYMSGEMPALQHLNSLLAFIWSVASQYGEISNELVAGPKCSLLQVALKIAQDEDLCQLTVFQMAEDAGVLPKGSARILQQKPNLFTSKTANATVSQLARFVTILGGRFPSCHFAPYCQNSDGSLKQLNVPHKEGSTSLLLLDGGLCRYLYKDGKSVLSAIKAEVEDALRFTPCGLARQEACCYVPGFLSGVVKSKLELWIQNALLAQKMTEDREYVLEGQGVVPVDYSSTGVLENFTTWSDGLHQFLELKHGLKLSNMTPISNYMSNVSLFQLYGAKIFGLTGTLGQQAEVETVQRLYGVKTCQIPVLKRKKLHEVEGVIVEREDDWVETICKVVFAQTKATSYRGQRAALVICETIKQAKAIHRSLRDHEANKGLFISNNMDNTEIFAKALEGGDIIVATNLAGRGADFKVSDQVKAAGGLFVVQTFLPENSRVEAQAFGRTARGGSPGSAQLIVCRSHLPEPLRCLSLLGKLESLLENGLSFRSFHKAMFVLMLKDYQRTPRKDTSPMRKILVSNLTKTPDSEIKVVKMVRDRIAAARLTGLLEDAIPKMKMKAELFQQFLRVRDKVPANSPKSEHLALNEFWGLWLLTNSDHDDSAQNLGEKLSKDLDNARKLIANGESPFSNLHHYSAAGNELMEKGSYEKSILMYTRAIRGDPCWAAFAFYNSAFARLRQNNQQDQNCIREAMEDLQQALASVEYYRDQIEFTQRCFKQVESHPSTSRFDHHLENKQKVLMAFKKNIDEALKKLNRARVLGSVVKVDKWPVHFLEPKEGLLLPGVLLAVHDDHPLVLHKLMSCPVFDLFHEFGCLKSLGLPHIYTLDTIFTFRRFLSKVSK